MKENSGRYKQKLQGDSDNKKVAKPHEQLNFLIFKKVAI